MSQTLQHNHTTLLCARWHTDNQTELDDRAWWQSLLLYSAISLASITQRRALCLPGRINLLGLARSLVHKLLYVPIRRERTWKHFLVCLSLNTISVFLDNSPQKTSCNGQTLVKDAPQKLSHKMGCLNKIHYNCS